MDREEVDVPAVWAKQTRGHPILRALMLLGFLLGVLSVLVLPSQHALREPLLYVGLALIGAGALGLMRGANCPSCRQGPNGQGTHCPTCGGPWIRDPTGLYETLAGVALGLVMLVPPTFFKAELTQLLAGVADRSGIAPRHLLLGVGVSGLLILLTFLLALPRLVRRVVPPESVGCVAGCEKPSPTSVLHCCKCGVQLVAQTL